MIIEAIIWSSGTRVNRLGFRLLGDLPAEGTLPDLWKSGIAERIQALCGLHNAVTEEPPGFQFVRSEDQFRKLAAHLLDEQRKSAVIVLSTRRNASRARAQPTRH